MRRILQLEVEGHRLLGTLHEPEGPPVAGRVGVLLVSFGQQPRAWVGDLGTATGDALAAAGFPVFRFDMPGTGDSPGELPLFVEVFWRSIQEGAHEPIAKALIRELQRRHGLRGLVVGGFCGGAITAVHAADAEGADVLGLVLLEPEVGLTPISREDGPPTAVKIDSVSDYLEGVGSVRRRLFSPQAWARLFSGRSDLSYWWGLLRYGLGHAVRKGTGQALPPDANRKLLDGWARSRARRQPMLVATVDSDARRTYYAAYGLQAGKSDPATGLTWAQVPRTTHAMLSGGAKEAVPRLVAEWLTRTFAAPAEREVPAGAARRAGPVAQGA